MTKYEVDDDKKSYKIIITCKECKYYRTYKYQTWDICAYFDKPMQEDDYCSKAKRKDKYEYSNTNL